LTLIIVWMSVKCKHCGVYNLMEKGEEYTHCLNCNKKLKSNGKN